MAAKKWSKVQVAIQSALAAAISITAITKANPGVATYSGADPVNGDYAILKVQGMHQLNKKVVRFANVNGAGNTVELENIDTTLYDTFTSGTFEVITFGTTMATVTGLSASGGDFGFLDTSTIHDNVKTQIPGQAEPLSYQLENLWDVSDAALNALKAASDIQAERAIRFTFSDNAKMCFNGYVGCTLFPVGNAHEVIKTPVSITAEGRPTYYAT